MSDDKWWHEGKYVWIVDEKRNTVKRAKVCTFRGAWRSWSMPRPHLQAGTGADKEWFSRGQEPTTGVYRTEMGALTALAGKLEDRAATAQLRVDLAVDDLNRANKRLSEIDDATKSVREQIRKAQAKNRGAR